MNFRQTSFFAPLLFAMAPLLAQAPVISPGGVVNAASYATTDISGYPSAVVGQALAFNSIVSIFGSHLASTTAAAATNPLPLQLAGTSVTVGGIAAPILFVSPGQINIEEPSTKNGVSYVVTTAEGPSNAVSLDTVDSSFGIFTQNGSGCGPGSIQNVASDGSVSLNSPSNSASPGSFITYYGTGLGDIDNQPSLGYAAPLSPLPRAYQVGFSRFDFSVEPTQLWAGLTPGYFALNQVNVQIPSNVREGCAVPLQGDRVSSISQPVTISIRAGGGACVDPPSAGYGNIVWQKTTITTTASTTETDNLAVSLQAWPGQQAPPLPAYTLTNGAASYDVSTNGPSCAIPGYRTLDAGKITASGPSFAPATAAAVPYTALPVSGLSTYTVNLPNGSIGPGSYTVAAAGGTDIAPFTTALTIGPDIQITNNPAGQSYLIPQQAIVVNWTGGDPNSWVTMTIIEHLGAATLSSPTQVRASAGSVKLFGPGQLATLPALPNAELVISVTPDPSLIVPFSATGLTLGGRHSWQYIHRLEGITLTGGNPP